MSSASAVIPGQHSHCTCHSIMIFMCNVVKVYPFAKNGEQNSKQLIGHGETETMSIIFEMGRPAGNGRVMARPIFLPSILFSAWLSLF